MLRSASLAALALLSASASAGDVLVREVAPNTSFQSGNISLQAAKSIELAVDGTAGELVGIMAGLYTEEYTGPEHRRAFWIGSYVPSVAYAEPSVADVIDAITSTTIGTITHPPTRYLLSAERVASYIDHIYAQGGPGGVALTATGSGPVVWSSSGSVNGVFDWTDAATSGAPSEFELETLARTLIADQLNRDLGTSDYHAQHAEVTETYDNVLGAGMKLQLTPVIIVDPTSSPPEIEIPDSVTVSILPTSGTPPLCYVPLTSFEFTGLNKALYPASVAESITLRLAEDVDPGTMQALFSVLEPYASAPTVVAVPITSTCDDQIAEVVVPFHAVSADCCVIRTDPDGNVSFVKIRTTHFGDQDWYYLMINPLPAPN